MKGTGEKHPQKMQEHDDQKYLATPVVNVPDQLPEKHVLLEAKDGFIRFFGNRLVHEFQQHARPDQHEQQHHGHAAETPSKLKSERAFRNASGAKMKNQAVEEAPIALSVFRYPLYARENGMQNALRETWLILYRILLEHVSVF